MSTALGKPLMQPVDELSFSLRVTSIDPSEQTPTQISLTASLTTDDNARVYITFTCSSALTAGSFGLLVHQPGSEKRQRHCAAIHMEYHGEFMMPQRAREERASHESNQLKGRTSASFPVQGMRPMEHTRATSLPIISNEETESLASLRALFTTVVISMCVRNSRHFIEEGYELQH